MTKEVGAVVNSLMYFLLIAMLSGCGASDDIRCSETEDGHSRYCTCAKGLEGTCVVCKAIAEMSYPDRARTVPEHLAIVERIMPIVVEMAMAYSNQDFNAVSDAWDAAKSDAYLLPWNYLGQAMRPINQSLRESFLNASALREFDTPEAFWKYLSFNIKVVSLKGEFRMEYKPMSDIMAGVEWEVLVTLQKYSEKYSRLGQKEYLEIANKALEDWKNRIDSPNGYTYQWMKHELKIKTIAVSVGRSTREKVVRMVRMGANGLISSGHTPKWLEEFK